MWVYSLGSIGGSDSYDHDDYDGKNDECDISSRDDDNNDNSSDNKYCLIVKCERCIFVLN